MCFNGGGQADLLAACLKFPNFTTDLAFYFGLYWKLTEVLHLGLASYFIAALLECLAVFRFLEHFWRKQAGVWYGLPLISVIASAIDLLKFTLFIPGFWRPYCS